MILKKKTGDVEFFTEAEAVDRGIGFVYWRDAAPGDKWVLSDDKYVVGVRYVREIREKHGRKIRTRRRVATDVAVRYPHGRRPLVVEDAIETKDYGLTTDYWWVRFDRAHPALRSMLMKAVLSGQLHMTDYRRYNRDEYAVFIGIADKVFPVYPSGKKHNWYQVRTFFNHQKVRDMIKKDIAALAKERGFNVKKVFDLLEQVEVMAVQKKDAKTLLALSKEIASIVGIEQALKGGSKEPPLLPGSDGEFDEIIERNKVKDAEYTDVPDAK